MIKNIGIIGIGGVGGYFGGKLCQLVKSGGELQVSFIARGEHLRAIQDTGLLLSSEEEGEVICRPSLATDDFARLPPLDLCVICVKEFDLNAALIALRPSLRDYSVVLPLLNGVDVNARVRTVIKTGVVLPACVYVGTHIERPGKVFQKGGACRILFGPDPERPDFPPTQLLELFRQAGIKCEWTPEIQVEIWKKFIFICSFGIVTAAHDKTLGEVLGDEGLKHEVRTVMHEIVTVAKKSGVNLPADIVEVSLAKAKTFPPEAKTSFQRDFERPDKADERDLFAGTVLRMAGELGIQSLTIQMLATALIERKPVCARRV